MTSRRQIAVLWVLVHTLLAAGLSFASETVTYPFFGITHTDRTETSPRPLRMHVIKIDLNDPTLGFLVTPQSGPRDTIIQTTRQFLATQAAQIAINAHFFTPFPDDGTGYTWLIGPAASSATNGSHGHAYAPFDENVGSPFQNDLPALNIGADNTTTLVYQAAGDVTGYATNPPVTLHNAVSGNEQILSSGVNVAGTTAFDNTLNPRTAIGIAPGNKLILFTVDGRQTGVSEGLTTGETANLLYSDYGVTDAINLDGGGSTTLAMADPAPRVVNVPVGVNNVPNSERSVSSNLGVFARACSVDTEGIACGDDDLCNGDETCSGGQCVGGPPLDCNDGDTCTDDACDATLGQCTHTDNTAPCDDRDLCTRNDRCGDGTCTGTPIVCTASDQCHTAGTCQQSTGLCSNPVKANGSACNDGNACTQSDSCQGGACTGATGATSSLNARVDESRDDAEESAGGSVSLTSSDLELTQDSSTQKVGMVFEMLGVPQGATITAAWIQFTAKETQSVTTNLTIQAQAIDNAPGFTTSSGGISSRARTAASVSWSPVPWTVVGEAGPKQKTPDLTSLIQQVVNRAGWASAHDVAIIIAGTGHRTPYSYDGKASSAPLLHVEWGSCGGGQTNQAPNGVIDTPAGNVRITAGQSASFTGSASDPDGNTPFSFSWDMGGGAPNRTVEDPGNTTFSTPGTFTVTFTVRDSPGVADPTPDRRVITVDPAGGGTTTLERRVPSGSDDAEQRGSSLDLSSSDLELVMDGSTNQIVGIRFTNITIPQGRTIQRAWIQFQADETQSETTNLTLQVQAIDNPPTFTSSSNNISSRSRTGSVAWSPVPAWGTVGQIGTNQRTADIKSLIQAVVSRPGWSSGNALAIIITGSGHRTAESFEGTPSGAPLLHIEY